LALVSVNKEPWAAGGLCELAQPRTGDPDQTGSPDQDRIGIEVWVAASRTCTGLRRKQRDEPS
jgi:hypothetical protein